MRHTPGVSVEPPACPQTFPTNPPRKMSPIQSLIAVIACAVVASSATAQTLETSFVGLTTDLPLDGSFDGGASVYNIHSGVMNFDGFQAFCFEPWQPVNPGEPLIYQVQDSQSLVNSEVISRLIGGYLASEQTAEDATAVQWAIWEMVVDSTLPSSLDSGSVKITDLAGQNTINLANSYIANQQNFAPANLTFLTNSIRQDVVTWNAIPEPSSALLGALGALALLRRKR